MRQDKIIENQSQSGEMMIKNTQNKKENSKNKSMLSEQYIQKKNIIQTQSQSGRSMVEMLGVLAIIAILSIGGIVGFRLAMNYYQANQIAHELNMMRTDAQIKIAQGTEKLTLGSPYDSGNIQFNGYKTVFDCLDMETETSAPDKVVSCAVANAYYIELQEIPEGVCKPLANLIDNMDNEIAFYINGNSVDAEEEKGACGEGDNTLRVIFGADSDSNAVKCDTDPECASLKNTPVCDTNRHVCVECIQKEDCTQGDGGICIENKCNYCADGEVRDESSQCVECTENNDCLKKGTDKPICNEENKCEPCPNRWSDILNKCVTCTADEHCTNKETNPLCNVNTGECEPCPDGQSWNTNKNMCTVGECESNDDCNINGRTGYYCYLEEGYDCGSEQEFDHDKGFGAGKDGYKSKCLNAESEQQEGPLSGYVISQSKMNWWSSQRYCLALQRTPATRMSIGCFIDGGKLFYCSSEVMNKLKSDFMNKTEGDYPNAAWLDDYGDECNVYAPDFNDGRIFPFPRHYYLRNGGHALCQPK